MSIFKGDEMGSKWSDEQIWPAVGKHRIRAFQRTLNEHHTTHTRACGALFVKTIEQCRACEALLVARLCFFEILLHENREQMAGGPDAHSQ